MATKQEDDAGSDLKFRQEGRKARKEGKPITACPYPADSQSNYQWTNGWMQPDPTAPEDAS